MDLPSRDNRVSVTADGRIRLQREPSNVEAHREHIRHKLGLKSAVALTQTAQRWVVNGS